MSWNFSALYVPTAQADAASLEQALGRPLPAKAFCCLKFMDGETPPDEALAALSRQWGECVFLWIDSHSDMMQYQHWRAGGRLRLIDKGDDGCWGPLEGEPEAWESRLFGTQEELEQISAYEPDQAEAWQEIWQGRTLVEASQCPFAGPEDLASLVAAVYDLELFPPRA